MDPILFPHIIFSLGVVRHSTPLGLFASARERRILHSSSRISANCLFSFIRASRHVFEGVVANFAYLGWNLRKEMQERYRRFSIFLNMFAKFPYFRPMVRFRNQCLTGGGHGCSVFFSSTSCFLLNLCGSCVVVVSECLGQLTWLQRRCTCNRFSGTFLS